jgi:hypothetical protein
MAIPQSDLASLTERGLHFQVSEESNMTCIVFPNYRLPAGCTNAQSDLMIRLSPGYPDVPPDMWWFSPPVQLSSGKAIEATQVIERHLGRDWQRWSRHFNGGQWRPGIDSLESFLALVHREVARSVKGSL